MRTLIKNGRIVTSVNEFDADILIEDEKIIQIGKDLSGEAADVADAKGKLIFPGGVDEHVHYGSFGGRLFETTDAAAVGGTTTIVDFIKGRPEKVYLRGKLVAEKGRFAGEKGKGEWQKCKPYAMCYNYYKKES